MIHQKLVGKTHTPFSTTHTILLKRSTRFIARKPSLHIPHAQQQNNSSSNSSNPTQTSTLNTDDIACVGTGSEVECIVPDTSAKATIPQSQSPPTLLDTALLISPFFFWGTSMVAMKELAPHTTPLLVAAWRLLPAGIALLLWAKSTGRKGTPSSLEGWIAVTLFGIVDGACFQGFLAEGLQRTSAGLGSVIIDSQPLSVAIMASIFFGERLGSIAILGLLLGVGGLVLLEVSPETLSTLLVSSSETVSLSSSLIKDSIITATTQSSSSSLWDSGEWWMLLAAQSMAIGTVMVRWVAKYCDPVAATGWHMILGGIPLLALAVQQEGDTVLSRISEITAGDIGLLLYVSLLGSAASYGVFFYEATVRGNLTKLSSLTFLTPVFAAVGGFLVLGEMLTPVQLLGAAVTLGGVACITAKNNSDDSNDDDGTSSSN